MNAKARENILKPLHALACRGFFMSVHSLF